MDIYSKKTVAVDNFSVNPTINDMEDLEQEQPSVMARVKHAIQTADYKALFIRNIFLVTLLLLLTTSMVLVKLVSGRLSNYPFTLGQAQPVITSTTFGLLWLLEIAFYYVRRRLGYDGTQETHTVDEQASLEEKKCLMQEEQKEKLFFQTEKEKKNLSVQVEEDEKVGNLQNGEIEEIGASSGWRLYFHLSVVGTFLSIGNILLFTGSRGTYVPGPISVLLQQMTIPATLFIAIFLWRTRFFLFHYLGALTVIAGVIVTLWPELNSLEQAAKVWAVLCIVGAAVCNAIGMGYMEQYVIQTKQMSLAWMWMIINLSEILTTVPLMLTVSPLQGISFDSTFTNIAHGYECLFGGINTAPDDNCSGAIYLYIPLIMVFVFSRLNIAYVIKTTNAGLMWFVATCALPLANLAFTLHFIMGSQTISLNAYMGVGLVIVVIGLLMYRLSREPQKRGYVELQHRIMRRLFPCCYRTETIPANDV